ncbi:MAG: hypothetical protein PHR71_06695 [Polaromonas sp.]|nr:hypothetical protein [Polaromonas sp.]
MEAAAMLNMLPKSALIVVRMYLRVFAKVLRPSSMPRRKIPGSLRSSTRPAASLATSTAVSTEIDRKTNANTLFMFGATSYPNGQYFG